MTVNFFRTLELVYFSMSIVHNATTFFATNKASDTLIQMFNNQNAGNSATLLPQLEYLATMTGVAGTIGTIVALGLPMLIMRGEIGGMLGAINALAGRYNNDARSVREQQAQTYEAKKLQEMSQTDEAKAYLKRLGISAPNGVGDLEYANRIRQGMDRVGQSYGAMIATSGTHSQNYQQGAMAGAVNQVGSTTGMGASGVNAPQAMQAGMLMGGQSGGNMMGLANSGASVQQAAMSGKLQGAQQGGNMMGLANSGLTESQARDAGRLEGKSKGISQQEQSKFADNKDYYEGVSRQTRSGLEKTRGMGMGDKPSESDWNDLARQSSGQFQEGFAGARGYNAGAMDGNNLKSSYAQGVESQAAKKAQTTATYGKEIDTQNALKAGESSGYSMAGADQGAIKALNDYGKEGVMQAARATTVSKTASVISGIKGAGSEQQYIDDQATRSEGMAASTRKAIEKGNEVFQRNIQGILSKADEDGVGKEVREALMKDGVIDENDNVIGGGYVGLQRTSSGTMTEQKAGQTAGLLNASSNPIAVKNAVKEILANGDEVGRGDELRSDLRAAGLIDKKDNVLAENWVAAKSFMQANNLNSHNAIIAGGMIHSGALGSNSTIKSNALNELSTGNKQELTQTKTQRIGERTEFLMGLGLTGTSKDPLAYGELLLRMGDEYGKETVLGAIDDAKHGNLDNLRRMFTEMHNEGGEGQPLLSPEQIEQTQRGGSDYGTGALITTAVGLTTVTGINKYTADNRKHIPMSSSQLKELNFDAEGKGYFDGDGRRVADMDGIPLDSDGKRIANKNYGKGIISRGAGATWGGLTNAFDLANQKLFGEPSSPVPKSSIDSTPDGSTSEPHGDNRQSGSTYEQQNGNKGPKQSTHPSSSLDDILSKSNFTTFPTHGQASLVPPPPNWRNPSPLNFNSFQQTLSDVPGSIGYSGTPSGAGGKKGGLGFGGKVGILTGLTLAGSEVYAATKDDISSGNYGKVAQEAAFTTAEVFDPTIFGVQTAREQGTIAISQLQNGQYSDAASTIAGTPKAFAQNAYNTGVQLRQMVDTKSSIAEELHQEVHGGGRTTNFAGDLSAIKQQYGVGTNQQNNFNDLMAKTDTNKLLEEQEQMQKEQRQLNVENNVNDVKNRADQTIGAVEDVLNETAELKEQLQEVKKKK